MDLHKHPEELARLIKQTNMRDLDMIEVGTYCGDGAAAFASQDAVRRIYCIDPWLAGYDPSDGLSRANMKNVEARFDSVAKRFPDKIIKCKGTVRDFFANHPNVHIDLAYIDACHKYECVKDDLLACLSRVPHIPLISGHDWQSAPHTQGVEKAVRELLVAPDLIFEDSSWLRYNWEFYNAVVVCPRHDFVRPWLRAYFLSGNTIPLIICSGPIGDWTEEDWKLCKNAAEHCGGTVVDCTDIWEECKKKRDRAAGPRRQGWYTKTAILHRIATTCKPKTWAWIDDDVEIVKPLDSLFAKAASAPGFIYTHFYESSADGRHPDRLFQGNKVNWNSLTVFHGDANKQLDVLKNDYPVEDDEIIFCHLYNTNKEWHDGFCTFGNDVQFICNGSGLIGKAPKSAMVVHYTSYREGRAVKNFWKEHGNSLPCCLFEDGASHIDRAILTCLTDGHIKPFLYWYLNSGSSIPLYIIKSNEWSADKLDIAKAAIDKFGGAILDYDDVWEYIGQVAGDLGHPAWGAKVMWWRRFIMSSYCPDTWMWVDSDVMINQPVERTFEWFDKYPDKFMGAQSRLGHKARLFKGRDWFNNYNIFRDRKRCLDLFNRMIKSQFDRKFFDDENNLRHVLVTLKNDDLLSGVQDMSADISYDEPLFDGFYQHDHAKYAVVHFGGGPAHREFKNRFADIERKERIDIADLLKFKKRLTVYVSSGFCVP